MTVRTALPLFFVFAFSQVAAGQSGALRGRVVDTSNEVITGVNVVLRSDGGRLLGTATQDGLYLMTRIPAGTYELTVSFVGFVTIRETLVIPDGGNVIRNFTLEEDESQLGQIVVESERTDGREYVTGLRTIRTAELELLPSASLSKDLATFLTTEAGVVTVGDRGGQLFVRGSTPSENIFLLDGMRVFQPLHLINAFSVYPADIVAFADVYSSGYGAYYGGRTGAVVDVTTRNGNKDRLAGSLSASPFLAAAHLELPIAKDRVSLLASVRQSQLRGYGNQVLGEDLPYRYGDMFFKLHGFLNETSNVSFTVLRSNDRGNLAGDPAIKNEVAWTNEAYGGNYFYLSPDLPVLTEITIGSTKFATEKLNDGEVVQSSSVEGIEGSFNFGYLLGAYQIHFGIFAHSTRFRYELGPNPRDRIAEFVTEGGIFAEARLRPSTGWQIVPGVRIQTFPSRGQSYLEPRFRISVPLTALPGNWNLSAAWGVYHQGLVGLTDDRTVSDVFTAWAPSERNRAVPKSIHYSVGVATEQRRWRLSVEAYSRSIENLGFPALGESLSVDTRFLSLSGFSRGIDTGIERRWPNMFARVSYGLAKTYYRDISNTFPPPHDRRHSLALLAQVNWRSYRLGAQFQLGSGLPFTQINGVFQRVPIDPDGGVSTDPGERETLFAEAYDARLPAYHRLDLSIERDVPLPQARR